MFPVFPVTREIVRKIQAGEVDTVGSLWLEAMTREQDPGIEHVDIPIRPEVLDAISLTLGPRATQSDRIIVESLVRRFTPNAEVCDSTLTGEIV
jgi:hypothetical protein